MGELIVADVGNSETGFGLFREGRLVGQRTLTTARHVTTDEAEMCLREVLAFLDVPGPVGGAILSCVVPTLTDTWRMALGRVCESRPLVVGPGLKTGLRMRYNDPSEVGPDRIADVVAAREAYGTPVVVVDLGTTTNIEAVDGEGAFLGGIIAPGMRLGLRAVSDAAARLPLVEIAAPRHPIGRSTQEAMQSGIVLGEAARIDGLLGAVTAELGQEAPIVLTGDDAPSMAGLLQHEVRVDETLTLRGLALLWQRNRRPRR